MMTEILVLFAALAPVVWLLWTIYRKDSAQPEPTLWLVKAFFYGVVSVFLSLILSMPIMMVSGIDAENLAGSSFLEAAANAFLVAAIPEEVAKFLMLWLLLRKNPYFDEHFDGIVYAVCVGLGFAALENVGYLFKGAESGAWIRIGIVRALFSVPGHYFFAILMGYYYSVCHFGIDRSMKARAMILVAPILAHGIYDAALFSLKINESLSGLLMIFFIFFFTKLRKRAKERIRQLV